MCEYAYMIPDNELRVGNYVYDSGNIVQIKPEHFVYAAMPDNGLEPIPLTPEILQIAGFKLVDSLKTCVRFISTKGSIFYINKRGKDYWLNGYKYYPAYIHNLHQLQNVYFALTGEEIKIEIK